MIIVGIVILLSAMAVYTGCAVWFLRESPKAAEPSRWLRIIVWVGYAALSIILPNLWYNDVITISVMTVYYLIAGWFLYHRSRTWLLYQLIFCMGTYAAQVIAMIFLAVITQMIRMDQYVISILLTLFKCMCVVLMTFIFQIIIRKRCAQDQKNLSVKGMVIVPAFSLILIYFYLSAGEIFFIRFGYGWIVVYCILLIAINAYCLYFWYDVAANRELKHRLELMEQQNELTHQYYEDMEKNYNDSRKIIHDIRNHLHILEQSSRMDDSSYFQDVHGMLNSLGLKFYSENRMLNIVLNDKLKKLNPGQIECNMGGVSLDFISDIDITTIFANLLDNAAEAGEMQKEFWLKIRGEQIQDFVVVKLWNSFRGEYKPGRSAKEGHEGIGLQNVKRAVEKYNGEVQVEYKEEVFSVTLVFPGK